MQLPFPVIRRQKQLTHGFRRLRPKRQTPFVHRGLSGTVYVGDIWLAGSSAPRGHSITQLGRGVGRRGPPTHSCTYITGEHTEDETRSERMRRVRDADDQPLYRVSQTYPTFACGNFSWIPVSSSHSSKNRQLFISIFMDNRRYEEFSRYKET